MTLRPFFIAESPDILRLVRMCSRNTGTGPGTLFKFCHIISSCIELRQASRERRLTKRRKKTRKKSNGQVILA